MIVIRWIGQQNPAPLTVCCELETATHRKICGDFSGDHSEPIFPNQDLAGPPHGFGSTDVQLMDWTSTGDWDGNGSPYGLPARLLGGRMLMRKGTNFT